MPGIRVSGLTDLELGSGAGEGRRAAGGCGGGVGKGCDTPRQQYTWAGEGAVSSSAAWSPRSELLASSSAA